MTQHVPRHRVEALERQYADRSGLVDVTITSRKDDGNPVPPAVAGHIKRLIAASAPKRKTS